MTLRYSDQVRVVESSDKSLIGKVGVIRQFDQIFERIALVEFEDGQLVFIHTDNLEKVWSYFDENGLGDDEEEEEEEEEE